jgi:hypothetical protein
MHILQWWISILEHCSLLYLSLFDVRPHASASISIGSSSSLSASAPTLALSTSVAAFDLRALPLPGPGGFALALDASTFARKADRKLYELGHGEQLTCKLLF